MKALFKTLLIALMVLAFVRPAFADYNDGEEIPVQALLPLMAWVEAQTGVRVPAPPRVIASRTYLTAVVSRMGRIAGRARAVYVSGNIVLDNNSFDLEDSTQVSLLVHEMVHYAQSFRRTTVWSCPQEKEVEAYTLQNKWLEEQGHSPYVRASWIERMSSCDLRNGGTAVAAAR
ncbi:MAG: hypothetical protein EOM37_09205 [Proteobacteria bacterium]|jgi:hypothetical protein|nr:hypothetical protein [Alphaproteobacteria bacterium]NCC04201.1 hypothetical protein [Pseudomonadota bacterium]